MAPRRTSVDPASFLDAKIEQWMKEEPERDYLEAMTARLPNAQTVVQELPLNLKECGPEQRRELRNALMQDAWENGAMEEFQESLSDLTPQDLRDLRKVMLDDVIPEKALPPVRWD